VDALILEPSSVQGLQASMTCMSIPASGRIECGQRASASNWHQHLILLGVMDGMEQCLEKVACCWMVPLSQVRAESHLCAWELRNYVSLRDVLVCVPAQGNRGRIGDGGTYSKGQSFFLWRKVS
jgi:hypothetical protein